MKKTKKFLIKMIYAFPVGFLFWMVSHGFKTSDIGIAIIVGFVLAFLFVFWNLFEYEKYDDILYVDFLESHHTTSIKNTEENWNNLKTRLNLQITKIKKTIESEDCISYQIDQKGSDSLLRIEKKNDRIVILIKRKYFNFIPDMAENYRILNKLVK